ncbi:MAG: RluA family pseudouridine synthase [Thalassobaculaceae bacterium]|nr:RluA family pseudouridine synthase [Thalassobaculaceae bacterium]
MIDDPVPFEPDTEVPDADFLVVDASAAALAALSVDRIDRWLAGAIDLLDDAPLLSRSRLKSLIQQGNVSDGSATITDPSAAVKPGAVYRITLPPPEAAAPEGQDLPLTVVFEDSELIVVDKPAGMTVHPAPGAPRDTLVNALIAHCGDSLSGIGGVRRPGIVHRIDKDTSGLLVVAKTDRAHAALAARFAAHDIDRAYRAVCFGHPVPPAGRIDAAIARHFKDRKRMAVVGEARGRHAITHYRTLERPDGAALLECRLETGRTHQIRVHLSHIGNPLIGDPVYGRGHGARVSRIPLAARDVVRDFPRQALHAAVLGFDHPVTGEPLSFESPLPDDLVTLLRALGLR